MTTLAAVWAALRRVPSIVWIGLAAVILLLAVFMYGQHQGELRERRKALTEKQTRDSVIVAHWDTVVKRDTIRLARTLSHYDTVRATLNIHDTTEVIRFVTAADSAIAACRVTVGDLVSSCAAKDTVIADLRGLLNVGGGPTTPKESWIGHVSILARAGASQSLVDGVRRVQAAGGIRWTPSYRSASAVEVHVDLDRRLTVTLERGFRIF
jgi:hypothetical protein